MLKKSMLCRSLTTINQKEGTVAVAILEAGDGEKANNTSAKIQWNATTVTNLDIFNGNVQARKMRPIMQKLKKKCC
jgi:hypothetical protein